jgi:hypothetical protein
MRSMALYLFVVTPAVLFGWPGPWLLCSAAFAAGWLAGVGPRRRRASARPGYLPAPTLADRLSEARAGLEADNEREL